MFQIKNNELIERMRISYEDELNNTCLFIRRPEDDEIIIKFKNETKNIRFDSIKVNVAKNIEGAYLNYHYDKDNEDITTEYINKSVENITEQIKHLLALENAIRLLSVPLVNLSSYLQMDKNASVEEREKGATMAKANLISQYKELTELFFAEL